MPQPMGVLTLENPAALCPKEPVLPSGGWVEVGRWQEVLDWGTASSPCAQCWQAGTLPPPGTVSPLQGGGPPPILVLSAAVRTPVHPGAGGAIKLWSFSHQKVLMKDVLEGKGSPVLP